MSELSPFVEHRPAKPFPIRKKSKKSNPTPKSSNFRGDKSTSHKKPGESLIKVAVEDLKAFFPTDDPKVLDKIQMTEEALYSTTILNHADYIRDMIKSFYPDNQHKDLVVTDATSCIGGTIMSCVKPFGQINAVELNPVHATIMANNLSQVFPDDFHKVNIINDNFLSIYNKMGKSNVVIIDPPWGGLKYYQVKKLKLYLNDKDGERVEMMDIIRNLADYTDMVFARLPFNYDMDRTENSGFEHICMYPFLKKYPEGNTHQAGRIKTLYHICVFSHIKCDNTLDANLDKYLSKINYRDINFTKV